jgi:hypothetical protein
MLNPKTAVKFEGNRTRTLADDVTYTELRAQLAIRF